MKGNQIYNYLIENCIGYDKRVKANQLMKIFNIKDHKTLRYYIQELRQNPEYEELVGSEAGKNGGYFIVNSFEEYRITVEHHYLRAMEMLKTYGIMKNKYLTKENEKLEV